MSISWVAASVRAHAMRRRRAGDVVVRATASSPDLGTAIGVMAASPYSSGLQLGMSLTEAQRAVTATVVWNLRVLAGWLPRDGVTMLRLLCGPLEISNVEERLGEMAGGGPAVVYRLGSLGTAWNRLSRATTSSEIADILASSPWGDPGGDSPRDLLLSMRTALVARATLSRPSVQRWAEGAGALLLARERFLGQQEHAGLPQAAEVNLSRALGPSALAGGTLVDLRARLPAEASWALENVSSPEDLWRAEARWWAVLDEEGRHLTKGSTAGPEKVLGAVALMAADAWRLRAALGLAARGGGRLEAAGALA